MAQTKRVKFYSLDSFEIKVVTDALNSHKNGKCVGE